MPLAASAPCWRWILSGAWRFALVSLIAFSVWAFGGKLFRGIGGEPTMYAAITLVFLGLSGGFLAPLAPGPKRLQSFYALFFPGFIAYAIVSAVFEVSSSFRF